MIINIINMEDEHLVKIAIKSLIECQIHNTFYDTFRNNNNKVTLPIINNTLEILQKMVYYDLNVWESLVTEKDTILYIFIE